MPPRNPTALGLGLFALMLAGTTGACQMTGPSDDQPETTKMELPDWRAMWDFQDPVSSEGRFRGALEVGRAACEEEYELIVTTQLARTLGLQGDFAGAHEALDDVEPRLEGASTEVRMRYLLERGRALRSSGDAAASMGSFLEAWELGQGAGLDHLTADAGHMLAITAEPDEALGWSERTMRFCEESRDERTKGWLGPLYHNTGWTHHDAGRYAEAMVLWQKSLDLRAAANPTSGETFIARWTVARGLRSLERYQEAMQLQEELLADRIAAGVGTTGYAEEEIGECLLALDRPDEARPWFAKAYEQLSQDDWLVANEAERLARLKELGAAPGA